jgi:hypothetical protein
MTRFTWCQLRCLYMACDLKGQLEPMHDNLTFPTGHVYNGTPCCYLIHPEEVFLYTLCKILTGLTQVQVVDTYIGGDTNWRMNVFPWMLKYLNQRYVNIISHQGLMRFLDNFPCFRCAIQQYIQGNHQHKLVDGTMMIIPGMNFMHWVVFCFIDDSIDQILTPFSEPHGDYKGAVHKAEYADAQQAFYLGHVEDRGIKVEPIFLPNGLLTLVDPMSAEQDDAGMLAMINLNEYLIELQCGRFCTQVGAKVYFCVFGNSAFSLGLQCIQSYYREFNCSAKLDYPQAKCNKGMRLTRIGIKKMYGMVSNLFCICCLTEGSKMAKKKPVAIKQL